MDYIDCTIKILDKLTLFWDDLAYNKRIKVTYGDLIFALLNSRCMKNASLELKIAERSLERLVPLAFPTLSRDPSPWRNKLLSLLDVKKCCRCEEHKTIAEFYSKERSLCKKCSDILSRIRQSTVEYKQYRRNYYYNNYEKERVRLSFSRAKRKKRNVAWANIEKIKEIYNNCPENYHVDHIIPLQGRYVSGLHVESNLQYLTATENLRKGNKFSM